jgi:uncharacterized RDD family membrane protein YckC
MTEPSRFSQATGRPRLTITLEDLEADAATTPVSPARAVPASAPHARDPGPPAPPASLAISPAAVGYPVVHQSAPPSSLSTRYEAPTQTFAPLTQADRAPAPPLPSARPAPDGYAPVPGAPPARVQIRGQAPIPELAHRRAGFWARFWALFLDGLVMVVPLGILTVIFLVLFGIVGLFIDYLLFTPALSILYFVYFEGGPRGQTPGKSALNIRVVSHANGGPITRSTAFGRQLARILSGIPFDLGYLWMLWDSEKQTWHDKLSGTIVVPVEAYPLP